MIKLKLIILFIFLIGFVFTPNTHAWYGAGYSQGWPNAITGGTGEITSTYYKESPLFYRSDEVIVINYSIKNPVNNLITIKHDLFLKLWKVERLDSETDTFTESQLYQKHEAGLDIQSPYKTIALGELELAPGQSSNLKAEFTITNPGYYQFDITDLDHASAYKPGHIYAAGFLRIKQISPVGEVEGANDERGDLRVSAKSIGISLFIVAIALSILLLLLRKRRSKIEE